MTRRMRIEDLTALAVPSQPVLSPDGGRIAYVLRTLDAGEDRTVDELWLADTDGGAPRRLTSGPGDAAPAWSPDGGRLAFLRDGQVVVLDLGGGEPERVTDLPLGADARAGARTGAGSPSPRRSTRPPVRRGRRGRWCPTASTTRPTARG